MSSVRILENKFMSIRRGEWTGTGPYSVVYFAIGGVDCSFVRVRNLGSGIKGGTQTEGVWEQDAEESI
jgi:hypothetical protein